MAVVWGAWAAGEVANEAERIAYGLRNRDVCLLNGLIVQYQYRLLRYFVHLTGRRDFADDLVQDTWLRVLERGSQYDGRSRFEPWLFAIARNLAIDFLRRPTSISFDSDESVGNRVYDSPSADASPFERAARSEDGKRLAFCLGSLDPLYREVLVLRFQEELSLTEVAEVVQAPVSTVSSRISIALWRHYALISGRRQMSVDVHSRARILIDQSLVGEISQTDDHWLRNHLAECAECETFQNVSHTVLRSLDDLSFGVTPGATDRIQRVVADRAAEVGSDRSLRLRALAAVVAALMLIGLGSSAAWKAASWVSAYANLAESSLHLGVLVFWLLPSLVASLILLVMPILRDTLKEEGHI